MDKLTIRELLDEVLGILSQFGPIFLFITWIAGVGGGVLLVKQVMRLFDDGKYSAPPAPVDPEELARHMAWQAAYRRRQRRRQTARLLARVRSRRKYIRRGIPLFAGK